jgi:hypothetical protein
VNQLRNRVALKPGLAPEHLCSFGGWGETERWPIFAFEISHRRSQHRGLAGAGGADDEHESIVSGDRRSGIGL